MSSTENTILLTRTFNAPRELVWKAWTTPELLARWWGPHGWSLSTNNMDFRPGGAWEYCMSGPNGEPSCGKAVYQEIVVPERIVYRDYFSDADGNPIEGMPETEVTLEFVEANGQTKLVSTTLCATPEDRDKLLSFGLEEGIMETWSRLDDLLPTL
jgi:uncharacterized protein YndB with AHSA1/START domain